MSSMKTENVGAAVSSILVEEQNVSRLVHEVTQGLLASGNMTLDNSENVPADVCLHEGMPPMVREFAICLLDIDLEVVSRVVHEVTQGLLASGNMTLGKT